MELELVEMSPEKSGFGSLLFYIEEGSWPVHIC